MSILASILENKVSEVAERKKQTSVSELKQMPFYTRNAISLKAALTDPAGTGIIAEYKRKSPSKGRINDTALVDKTTIAYTNHGASGLSVLTDELFFGGTLSDLVASRINHIPILRKDFIVDEYQVYESKAYGADVILLIAACLSRKEVKHFSRIARNIGLEVLLEIHEQNEFDYIGEETDMVGINNRNLKTFEVSVQTSLDLGALLPPSTVKVSESGISNVATLIKLKKAGFNGFLIGEEFMKQSNPSAAFSNFVHELNSYNED